MTEPRGAPAPRRVVVIDSGIDPRHPGVRDRCRLIAGPAFDDAGVRDPAGGLIDDVGHGSAVAAAILRHAPGVEVVAVRVFDVAAGCAFERVLHALRWSLAAEVGATVINTSLGTTSLVWREPLLELVQVAQRSGVRLVAPALWEGLPVWPGCLDGVDGVVPDPNVPEGLPQLRDDGGGRRYWLSPPTGGQGATHGVQVRAAGVSLATAHVSALLLARAARAD